MRMPLSDAARASERSGTQRTARIIPNNKEGPTDDRRGSTASIF
jgi:hypothetical protein